MALNKKKKRENLMKLKYENVITEQLLTTAMVMVATAAMSFQWFVLVHLAINDIVAA